MTQDLDFATLQALCDRATPGPWSAADEHGLMPGAEPAWCVSRMDGDKWLYDVFYAPQSDPAQAEHDAAFVAAARNALPALLARLRRDLPDGSEGISGPREGNVCDWCKAAPKCNGTNPTCESVSG